MLVDMGVYSHGFLRTAWSTKRNSKRMKVPVGAPRGPMGAADEVHLVGKPGSFGGGFWSEFDVSRMCKVMDFEYEFALAKWGKIWKLETGQKLPHTRKPTTELKVCGVAPSGDFPLVRPDCSRALSMSSGLGFSLLHQPCGQLHRHAHAFCAFGQRHGIALSHIAATQATMSMYMCAWTVSRSPTRYFARRLYAPKRL